MIFLALQYLGHTYTQKIICWLSEIQIQLCVLNFYLLSLAILHSRHSTILHKIIALESIHIKYLNDEKMKGKLIYISVVES